MIRFFLVEDEIAMREEIKHRIKWRENGIDFCGEAGDGELAWPQILEKKPDVVITDIKMPFMDGLQLSKLIRRELPDTRIIILSGYDEFEYAQDEIPMLPVSGNKKHIDTENVFQNDNLKLLWEQFLRTGAAEETETVIEGVFSAIGDENMKSVVFLHYILIDAYLAMGRFLKKIGHEPKEADEKCGDINEMLVSLKSTDDAKRYLTAYLQEVLRIRDGSVSSRNSRMLQEAVAYIDGNYTDGELSLTAAAKVAGMSPNRFSSLFSQEMGMTFIEYLTGKRIGYARELLMTTDLRSSEIAYTVGYRDPHYFSATFKRIQGISPREYRIRGRGEDGNR